MFQEKYKAAYDAVTPAIGSIEELYKIADLAVKEDTEKRTQKVRNRRERRFRSGSVRRVGGWYIVVRGIIRPAAVTVLSCCLLFMIALPAAAKQIPGVYRVVEKYAPALADFVLPVEIISTKQGITMQVEAIEVQGSKAEIIVSFTDAPDGEKDLINGRVDLNDSYKLYNYSAQWQVGGCCFLEYDPGEDKAYFKITTTASNDFDGDKVSFGVSKLLTEYSRETRLIGYEPFIEQPKEKVVSINGRGSRKDYHSPFLMEGGTEESPLYKYRVMDLGPLSAELTDTVNVIGVAFENNVLRVQQCRGTFADADRHIRLFLRDENGEERTCDESVMWHEEIAGQKVIMEEAWFVLDKQETEQLQLWGEYWIADGCVSGDWEVTFEIEDLGPEKGLIPE